LCCLRELVAIEQSGWDIAMKPIKRVQKFKGSKVYKILIFIALYSTVRLAHFTHWVKHGIRPD